MWCAKRAYLPRQSSSAIRSAIDRPMAKSYRRREIVSGNRRSMRRKPMKWTTPRIVEIAVGLEINSYACADLA